MSRQGMLAMLIALFLSGCTGISDFTERSTVYGWVDIRDVDANRLGQVAMYQHKPVTKKPQFYLASEKMEGGYIFYTHDLPKGAFKLESLSGLQCLLIFCGNTTFNYNLGRQGKVGATVIEKPGVYYLGSFKLSEVDNGWFGPSEFTVEEAKDAPNRQQMLERVLEGAPKKHPEIGERIRHELEQ